MASHGKSREGRLAGAPGVMPSEFALGFSGDERYARGLAVALHSALTNLSPAFSAEIVVLDNDLSTSSRERLLRVVDATGRRDVLHWRRIPAERLAHLASESRLGPASYARLLIPELVPRHIRRVVYLDSDLLVRRDLSPLFTVELGDALVGAVRDFAIGSTVHEMSGVRDPDRSRAYFNAGVLVMDVERWRSEGLANRSLEYAAAGSEPLPWADQDALNALLESWHELDYRWNVQQRNLFMAKRLPRTEMTGDLYRQRWNLYRSAAVLHFVGPNPWEHWCGTRGTRLWLRALLRTGWYTRGEALTWLLRWHANWARHWVGVRRKALWTRLVG